MTTSQIEIERGWLLLNFPQCGTILKCEGSLLITQFYVNGWRYRQTVNDDINNNGFKYVYEKIRKVKIKDGINSELDITPLTVKQYEDAYNTDYPIITKRRFIYKDKSMPEIKFEVDDFCPLKLLKMEIELPTEDYKLVIPDNIQNQIIMEVTGNDAFSNFSLAKQIKHAKETWR